MVVCGVVECHVVGMFVCTGFAGVDVFPGLWVCKGQFVGCDANDWPALGMDIGDVEGERAG